MTEYVIIKIKNDNIWCVIPTVIYLRKKIGHAILPSEDSPRSVQSIPLGNEIQVDSPQRDIEAQDSNKPYEELHPVESALDNVPMNIEYDSQVPPLYETQYEDLAVSPRKLLGGDGEDEDAESRLAVVVNDNTAGFVGEVAVGDGGVTAPSLEENNSDDKLPEEQGTGE